MRSNIVRYQTLEAQKRSTPKLPVVGSSHYTISIPMLDISTDISRTLVTEKGNKKSYVVKLCKITLNLQIN